MGGTQSTVHFTPSLSVAPSVEMEEEEAIISDKVSIKPTPEQSGSQYLSETSIISDKSLSNKKDVRLQNVQSFNQIKENFQRSRKRSSANNRAKVFADFPEIDQNQLMKNKSFMNRMSSWKSFHASKPHILRDMSLFSLLGRSEHNLSSSSSLKSTVSLRSDAPSPPNIFESLIEGTEVLVSNKNVRVAFIRYIQKRTWVETLMIPIKTARIAASKTDATAIGGIKCQNYCISPRSRRPSYEETADHFMDRINVIQQLKINATREEMADGFDQEKAAARDVCFGRAAMQTIVLATLWPLFVRTAEYEQALASKEECDDAFLDTVQEYSSGLNMSSDESENMSQSHASPTPAAGRSSFNLGLNLGVRLSFNTGPRTSFTGINRSASEDVSCDYIPGPPCAPSAPNTPGGTVRKKLSNMLFFSAVANTKLMLMRTATMASARRGSSSKKPAVSLHHPADSSRMHNIYLELLDHTSAGELDGLLQRNEWAAEFPRAIEDMSTSLTVAAAPTSRDPRVPLIYVNRAFERMTQYKRRDVLGGTCEVLQCAASEKEQIQKMHMSVHTAQPCKVAVCNVRRNRSEFVNFIALQPVHTLNNIYKYVLGVQYDASDSDASARDIRLIDDCLVIVANLINKPEDY